MLLLTAVVAAGVLGREAVVDLLRPAEAAPPAPAALRLPPVPGAGADAGPSVAVLRQQALRRANPGLAEADAETRAAIDAHVAAIDSFFIDVKGRTPRFAKKILGWSSKWRLVSDKLPFTRDDRHALFLERTFRAELFTPYQLTRVINQTTRNYADTVAGIENAMLVRVRADVGDLPPTVLPEFVDDAKLRAAFEQAMNEATERTRADLRADVTRETLSLVAGEVLAMVAVRLGVSGGILAAGAGTSWATVGVGLVVAVIVDQIVSWVWNWWRDPAGDVSHQLNEKFDEIRRLIVEGDGAGAPGLRARLLETATQRDRLRRAAMAEVITSPETITTRPAVEEKMSDE